MYALNACLQPPITPVDRVWHFGRKKERDKLKQMLLELTGLAKGQIIYSSEDKQNRESLDVAMEGIFEEEAK